MNLLASGHLGTYRKAARHTYNWKEDKPAGKTTAERTWKRRERCGWVWRRRAQTKEAGVGLDRWREETTCRIAQLALTVISKLVMWWSDQQTS